MEKVIFHRRPARRLLQSRGIFIAPSEIENAKKHPAIVEAAVIAEPTPTRQ
jgi:acyl-coenzyme A synthetase/AMP-(fatty) acid ligase